MKKKKKTINSKEILELLLPGLDWVYGQDYGKYDKGYKNKKEIEVFQPSEDNKECKEEETGKENINSKRNEGIPKVN